MDENRLKDDFVPDVTMNITQPAYLYDINTLALLESTKENDACYTEALVTFIDILGFKSMVESVPANRIANILSAFQHVSRKYSNATIKEVNGLKNVKKLPQVIYFSDSLVRIAHPMGFHGADTTNYEAINRSIDIEFEITDIAHFQRLLLLEGVLIRGGITFGRIYSDGKSGLLFGPAMNRAYYIENNLAKYPRIVIDPEIIKSTSINVGLKCKDEDGLTSIDYFNFPAFNDRGFVTLVDDCHDSELFNEYSSMQFEMFEKRKEIINQGIINNANESSILNKYYWLTKKHNDSVSYFIKIYKGESQDLKLSGIPKREQEYYL